jgi:hypothetical protein
MLDWIKENVNELGEKVNETVNKLGENANEKRIELEKTLNTFGEKTTEQIKEISKVAKKRYDELYAKASDYEIESNLSEIYDENDLVKLIIDKKIIFFHQNKQIKSLLSDTFSEDIWISKNEIFKFKQSKNKFSLRINDIDTIASGIAINGNRIYNAIVNGTDSLDVNLSQK